MDVILHTTICFAYVAGHLENHNTHHSYTFLKTALARSGPRGHGRELVQSTRETTESTSMHTLYEKFCPIKEPMMFRVVI